ncbi:8881_t:CDS:2 [Acaulospora morrowiae]|uniref:8881_t:CDS:1 n=1 Tax=Acaulospora morrowiae TaxID=94023 RepID=A0A9N9DQ09_9GLOM|nr:8881_t:CDS:2 [Acaulospora morrowiae]
MTIKQEKVDEDLEEMTIGHPSEILKEHPDENKAQVVKDDQRNNVMKSSYNRAQVIKSIGMLDKRNDKAKELASKPENNGLVRDIKKEHYQEKILVASDSPNSCEKMTITDDRAIVPKVISNQIEVEDESKKGNKLVMSHEQNKELFNYLAYST